MPNLKPIASTYHEELQKPFDLASVDRSMELIEDLMKPFLIPGNMATAHSYLQECVSSASKFGCYRLMDTANWNINWGYSAEEVDLKQDEVSTIINEGWSVRVNRRDPILKMEDNLTDRIVEFPALEWVGTDRDMFASPIMAGAADVCILFNKKGEKISFDWVPPPREEN